MKSKKVKEIKESLQQEIHLTEYVDEAYAETMSLDLLKDVLTLINELESENAKLLEENESLNGSWKNAIKRIAELEKVYDRQVRIINDLNIEVVKMQEKLTKFAERVKEKLFDLGNIVNENDIDETLKEFINEQKI